MTKRDSYLRHKYGITEADYNRQLKEQDYSCAICKKLASNFKKRLAVDHNHKTGKARGLLCFYCNHKFVGRHSLNTARVLYQYMRKYEKGTK